MCKVRLLTVACTDFIITALNAQTVPQSSLDTLQEKPSEYLAARTKRFAAHQAARLKRPIPSRIAARHVVRKTGKISYSVCQAVWGAPGPLIF